MVIPSTNTDQDLTLLMASITSISLTHRNVGTLCIVSNILMHSTVGNH